MNVPAPGFSLPPFRGWSDILAAVVLLGTMIAAIQWGIKLDDRQVSEASYRAGDEQRISKIETLLASGQMAAAQTRISEQQRQIDALNAEVRELEHYARK